MTGSRWLAGPGRVPGSRVIAFATWLLVLLIEAAMLDAGMVILSALGIGLAQAGKPSASVRVLIVICAGASAA
jgi:hypothetical protein